MIQNHCVSIKQATVLFFSSFLLAACGEPQLRTSVREKGRLTVVMDEPLPGYFVFGGESYGYQYDLFKAYADHLGVELQVVRSERPSEYDAMLADGRADIVTALSDHAAEIASASAVPIYHTSYVLLAGKRKADEIRKKKRFELIPCIREGKVLISSGFKSTRAYSMLLDSLSRTAEVYVSSRNSFELIGALGDGRYDYLICEMSEAQLGCAFQKNVGKSTGLPSRWRSAPSYRRRILRCGAISRHGSRISATAGSMRCSTIFISRKGSSVRCWGAV